ncbi:SDR family NAD(P)-dependent oxidoreductase [Chitinimonas lacunae]|uniref:SDR family NAD(P)-dependent oxidoreductase n=1 Tax=Chitinimonas lacunae TaxID=1963018 RepID=A0ABV8MNF7_9NEIS
MATAPTIFITGCSSGIGACCAEGLRQRGWRVFAGTRRQEDVARLAAAGFEAIQIDLDDSDSIAAAARTVLAASEGRLDALFNNAGFGQPGAVEDLSRTALREQFETNLFGTVELTNLLLPAMVARKQGRVLFNSSVLGFAAMPYRGAYNASKFAMEGLVDTLRLELAGTGVHPVLIEPGPIVSRFRPNAFARYQRHIAGRPSRHAAVYQAMEDRLNKPGPVAPFTLPPEAVLDAVLKALTARRPRPRYRVTLPTKFFALAKRLLPTRLLDQLLQAGAGSESRPRPG